MPKYTVTYFDVPGRAQVTRHLFVVAGIDFEDKRVGGESWMAIKPSAPLKQLPILDVEGQDTICQSPAMERFVAKLGGLAGKTDLEAVVIDQIHTTLAESGTWMTPYFFGPIASDEEKKEELRKTLIADKLPVPLDFLNRKLAANADGGDYFVGKSVTLADIAWASSSVYLRTLDKDGILTAKYPNLFAVADRVLAMPAIQDFNAKHKK